MKNMISFFRAMGEDTRVKIISMLLEEEKCICDLIEALKISQSAVSHHVKILKQADLVNDRRKGKWTYYSINKSGFEKHIENFHNQFVNPIGKYEYKEKTNYKTESGCED